MKNIYNIYKIHNIRIKKINTFTLILLRQTNLLISMYITSKVRLFHKLASQLIHLIRCVIIFFKRYNIIYICSITFVRSINGTKGKGAKEKQQDLSRKTLHRDPRLVTERAERGMVTRGNEFNQRFLRVAVARRTGEPARGKVGSDRMKLNKLIA